MLERSQFLAGMVAFLMEIIARRKEGRHVGARWPVRRRHRLLAADQLVVHIGTEFMELGRRQSKELVASFIRSSIQPVVGVRGVQESLQGTVVLRQDLLDLAMPSATTALIVAQCPNTGSRGDGAGRGWIAAAGGRRHCRAQGRTGDAGGWGGG